MSSHALAVLVTIGFSVVGVIGDYFLKLASQHDTPLRSGWFYVGFAVYASTAFGWVFVMRHMKLAAVGVVYSISMIVLLTALGSIGFGESLGARGGRPDPRHRLALPPHAVRVVNTIATAVSRQIVSAAE